MRSTCIGTFRTADEDAPTEGHRGKDRRANTRKFHPAGLSNSVRMRSFLDDTIRTVAVAPRGVRSRNSDKNRESDVMSR